MINSDIVVAHRRNGRKRWLTMTNPDGTVLLESEFSPPYYDIGPDDNFIAFAEEEHFDFDLFVAKVLNDEQRRNTIYMHKHD